jgi:hypothetical protein
MLEKVLETVRCTEDASMKSALLADLSQLVNNEAKEQLLDEAWDAVWEITGEPYWTFTQPVQYVNAVHQKRLPRILHMLLDAIQEIDDEGKRSLSLKAVSESLSRSEKSYDLANKALCVARTISVDKRSISLALSAVAGILPEDESKAVIVEALEAAIAVEEENRAGALSVVAKNLPDEFQAHRIARPVIELGAARALMRRHHLRLLQHPAVCEINRDPGRPEAVAADLCGNPGRLRPPLNHVERIGAGQRPLGELSRPPDGTPEQRPLLVLADPRRPDVAVQILLEA